MPVVRAIVPGTFQQKTGRTNMAAAGAWFFPQRFQRINAGNALHYLYSATQAGTSGSRLPSTLMFSVRAQRYPHIGPSEVKAAGVL